MNKVILSGRLTKDPEVKQTPSNIAVCSFTIASDRKFKTSDGEKQTDFVNCVAWRKAAELLGNYFHKGSRIMVVGSIQTRSYDDQSGKRVFVTEVVVDEIEFLDTKADAKAEAPAIDPFKAEVVPVPPVVNTPTESDADTSALPFDIYGY